MAITNGYATLAQFKTMASLGAGTTHDADAERAVEAASRRIDRYCGRRFYVDSSASARYYTARPEQTLRLPVDDISTTTGLLVKTDDDWDGVYENSWTLNIRSGTYGFMVEPTNYTAQGRPITRLHAVLNSFPTVPQGVEVTAKWGWAAVPEDIETATLLVAARLFKRKDAPFSIAGQEGVGMLPLPKIDPDERALIDPYRRMDDWGD